MIRTLKKRHLLTIQFRGVEKRRVYLESGRHPWRPDPRQNISTDESRGKHCALPWCLQTKARRGSSVEYVKNH